MDKTVEQIAARLTEAQRKALLASVDYEDGSALFRRGQGRGMCPLGLGNRSIDGIELSPIGLAVRAILQEQSNAD